MNEVLSDALQFRTAFSFTRFRANLQRGDYDIALIQPYDYTVAVKSGYIPVAQMRGSLSARFFVREDNAEIRSIDDLRGKTIAMPPANSALAHLGLEYLQQHNLNPNHDVRVDFRRSHDSCVEQVLKQRAHACVTSDLTVEKIVQLDSGQRLKAIATSRQIPTLFFAVHQRLDSELIEKIKSMIIGLRNDERGQQILGKVRLDEFVAFRANEYQQLQ
jgi:ABC-type phosphate/phosphonate transport system substrate-binding protein